MALFDDAIIQEVLGLVRQRYRTLGGTLAVSAVDQTGEPVPLERDLRLLVEVANGAHARTRELVAEVEAALASVLDALLGNTLGSRAIYPEGFWQSQIGVVVSRARWWVSAEDLITISNAAALAYGENTQATRMRIARAIENGALDWVPDPSVANPQHSRRVLRSQVERLNELSRLSEEG